MPGNGDGMVRLLGALVTGQLRLADARDVIILWYDYRTNVANQGKETAC
jgi:hypothetical protein